MKALLNVFMSTWGLQWSTERAFIIWYEGVAECFHEHLGSVFCLLFHRQASCDSGARVTASPRHHLRQYLGRWSTREATEKACFKVCFLSMARQDLKPHWLRPCLDIDSKQALNHWLSTQYRLERYDALLVFSMPRGFANRIYNLMTLLT